MSAAARTTRAIRIEKHGPPEVFVEREIPLQDPGAGEVSIRVEAAGINFADLMMRAGLYDTVPPRPYSPGFEIAGVVTRVGEGAVRGSGEKWREGDACVGLLRHGGYARDVVLPTRNVFERPEGLSAVEAAAAPVVFLTAHVCLFESARIREGETALILGAAGGVGTAAVQLARGAGLRVIGTAGTEAKRRFVTDQLGAEACFDSRGDWEPGVAAHAGERGIDVALDAVGGNATRSCQRLLAPLGRIVFYGLSDAMPGRSRNWLRAARAWLNTPRFHPLSLIKPGIGISGVHLLHLHAQEELLREHLGRILDDVASGRLRAVVDRSFPLTREGAVAAHRYIHERRNLGKVVLSR
ncbi:MAG: zinc-binding dehydrogenase [marine benthic group bacterium]|nr:zinc-binding dehydrogenase [Gemmatimonadota bacterium]